MNAILSSPGLANLNPHQENQRARHVCSGTREAVLLYCIVLYQQKNTHMESKKRETRRILWNALVVHRYRTYHRIPIMSTVNVNVERHVLGAPSGKTGYQYACTHVPWHF